MAFTKFADNARGAYGATLSPNNKLTQLLLVKGYLAVDILLNAIDNPLIHAFFAHCDTAIPAATHLGKHLPAVYAKEVRGNYSMLL